jgi:HEAT repeat protein
LECRGRADSCFRSQALGYCGSEKDADYLIAYRKERDPSDSVAGEIIFALGELKSDAAAEHLIEVLSNPDTKPGRKILCIEALGKIGSQKALEPLLEATEYGCQRE